MAAPLIEIRDLHVSFAVHGGEVPAVRGASFKIPAGGTVALVAAVPEPDLNHQLDFAAPMEGKASLPDAWPGPAARPGHSPISSRPGSIRRLQPVSCRRLGYACRRLRRSYPIPEPRKNRAATAAR